MYISKSKRSYNTKPSVYYFYVKTKISLEFYIYISVPLTFLQKQPPEVSFEKEILKISQNSQELACNFIVGTLPPFFLKVSEFSHRKEVVGKIGGCFKKGSIIYFHTNPLQCYLSLSVWCACVRFVYLP